MSQGVVKVIAQGPTGPAGAGGGGGGGTIPVTQGGTGATTAAGARTNLGVDAAGTASSAVAAHASGTGVHSIAGVTGLQDALDAKETSGTASTAVAVHAAAADPHPGYRLESDTTDAISEGSANLYHTAARVRAAVLTGLSTATNAVIDAADTVLAALGKLQAQTTANLAALTSHTGNTSNPHSVTAAQVGALAAANNLSDLVSASTARSNLGLGSAATASTGTSAGNVVVLDGSAKLPAVDGSQLTNLPSGGGSPGGSGTELQYRSEASSFGAVTGSSVDGANLTLGGKLVTAGGPNGGAWWGESATSGCELIGNSLLYTAAGSITATINRSDTRGFSTTWGGAFAWGTSASNANVFGSDTALLRDAAGVVKITDGGTNLRDLKLRNLIATGQINLPQYTTATRPTFTAGALIYDSDLDKALIGGASTWETVTSS